MQNGALRLSSPHPRADVLEIFKSDPPLRALSLPNNAFADRVVDILCKARLLSRQFPESSLCRQGSFFLEVIPEPPMPIPNTLDGAATVDRTVAIRGDVPHTEIDPKHVVNVLRIGFLYLTGCQQIPVAAMVDQIGFAHAGLKQLHLALTSDKGDRQASQKRPDRHRWLVQVPRENAVIIGDGGEWAEGALGLLVELVAVAYFGKRTNNHLRRQAERLSHILIDQLLKCKFAKGAHFPRHPTDVVACSIGRLKRVTQSVSLIGRRLQFQLCGQFHILNYRTKERHMQPERTFRAAQPDRASHPCGALPAPPHGLKAMGRSRKESSLIGKGCVSATSRTHLFPIRGPHVQELANSLNTFFSNPLYLQYSMLIPQMGSGFSRF